jgi:hypothetical protein
MYCKQSHPSIATGRAQENETAPFSLAPAGNGFGATWAWAWQFFMHVSE